MAYSDKINHPKVKRYRFIRRFLPIIITVLSTAILAICIGIRWGLTEPRPISVVIAAAVILFFATGGKRVFDRDFDGTVTDKKLRRVTTVEGKRGVDADRYMLIVTDDNGGVHEYAVVESVDSADRANAGEVYSRKADAVEYYRRGDRVRHHAGMKLYEKEDKSKDRRILCCGCLVLTDKDCENCRSCGLPLFK